MLCFLINLSRQPCKGLSSSFIFNRACVGCYNFERECALRKETGQRTLLYVCHGTFKGIGGREVSFLHAAAPCSPPAAADAAMDGSSTALGLHRCRRRRRQGTRARQRGKCGTWQSRLHFSSSTGQRELLETLLPLKLPQPTPVGRVQTPGVGGGKVRTSGECGGRFLFWRVAGVVNWQPGLWTGSDCKGMDGGFGSICALNSWSSTTSPRLIPPASLQTNSQFRRSVSEN